MLSVLSVIFAFCVVYTFGELLYYKIKEQNSLKDQNENDFHRNLSMPSIQDQVSIIKFNVFFELTEEKTNL